MFIKSFFLEKRPDLTPTIDQDFWHENAQPRQSGFRQQLNSLSSQPSINEPSLNEPSLHGLSSVFGDQENQGEIS